VPDRKIIIARLGAAYGIKGWLHLTSFTDPVDNIFQYQPWHLKKDKRWEAIALEAHKSHGNSFVVKLKGCDDRDRATQLKGSEIAVNRTELPKTAENEYYWSDLMGLTVKTMTGETLGTIDYLFETGANDVVVTKGKKQHFIPYIGTVIKHIDLEKQEMIVDWEPII